jgi:hypothetical protein
VERPETSHRVLQVCNISPWVRRPQLIDDLETVTSTLLIGPPQVGKTKLSVGLGLALVEADYCGNLTTAADPAPRCRRAANRAPASEDPPERRGGRRRQPMGLDPVLDADRAVVQTLLGQPLAEPAARTPRPLGPSAAGSGLASSSWTRTSRSCI